MNTFNTPKTETTTNVWLTPRYVLDLLGQFDTDPCAATVRPWDCARINYTVEDNGLLLPWEGRVWLNPPYGKEAEAFMERMSMHHGGGLALIFMRSDTRWFLIRHAAGLHPAAHAPRAAALTDAAVFLFAAPGQQRDPGGALYGFRPDIFGAGKQGCWDIDEFHN